MKRSQSLLSLIALAMFFIVSCSEETLQEVASPEETNHFFLKDETGNTAAKIEAELRMPVYEHLVSLGRNEDAENFLLTYDESGALIPNYSVSKPEKPTSNARTTANPAFNYGYHLQGTGWGYGSDISVNELPSYYEFGTTGQSRRLEAYYLILQGVDLCYESHLQGTGWQSTKCNGSITGTTGESRRMEATRIWINDGAGFVYYKSHLQGIGWESNWSFNGAVSGTTGQSRRMEALRIQFYIY
ncbi:hypothetical protein [Reichenbachiella versicolor]|uniref:hypothetical protein n=1 Tax=Reichenbachiella versicolor TaxID=1821036 RepID=UPI000D6E17F8|nr:hypothetical protein [Reichenbachiella versicolor]